MGPNFARFEKANQENPALNAPHEIAPTVVPPFLLTEYAVQAPDKAAEANLPAEPKTPTAPATNATAPSKKVNVCPVALALAHDVAKFTTPLTAAADTGHVVGVRNLLAVDRRGGELAALRPREGIVLAVVVIGAVDRDVFDHQAALLRDDDARRVLPVREVVVEAHVLLFDRHDLHFTPLAKSAISRPRLESC